MITPAEYNFPSQKRLTWFKGLTIRLNNKETKLPLEDITGYKIECWIRKLNENGPVIKRFSTEDGTITITDGANTEFKLNEFKIDLPAGTHYQDIFMTNTDDEPQCYVVGTWNIETNITGIQK